MKTPMSEKLKQIIDLYNAGYDNETLNQQLEKLDYPITPTKPTLPAPPYGLTPEQFNTIILAATSYFDDWSSGLEDGTYEEETRTDCDELELALAAYGKPANDEAETLLRRALAACNQARRFKFGIGDNSYTLATDIERYLKATTGKNPYTNAA